MQTSAELPPAREHYSTPDAPLVYCGLFDDKVAERVCHLLKKELRAWWKGDLFCRGCSRR